MKDIKGIIFDLDGVLLSTDKYHFMAWKKLADRLGINFTEKDNERLRGVSRMESLEIVLSLSEQPVKLSEDEKIALATEKNNDYRLYLEELTPDDITDEVRTSLKALRNKGYKLAIGSSSKNTKFILKKTCLDTYFDAIADGNDIKNSKPDPEVFLKAASFIGFSLLECAVIEDAEAGLTAANNGGFMSIGYASAYDSPLAEVHLEKFSDLCKLF
ncbi:MAG: beta-phosphoglucomutase [Clostridia bacterium]|nr:beta-phosphoglucomutase [Clostridia bacterium]